MSKRIFKRTEDSSAQPLPPVQPVAPKKPNPQQKADSYQTSVFPTWCPGCGNFPMWTAFRNAAADLDLNPEQTLVVYGIGCAGNGSNFYKSYGFHGLHGRALPVATGARLANPNIKVIAMGGDGDMYGIGAGHFIHAMRRNLNILTVVHNNQIYALTTGQYSPTSQKGMITKSTPDGAIDEPINPLSLALVSGATFVARTFAGDLTYTREIYKQALQHKGFALVDVFQPCITFNKINTYQWFRKNVYKLEDEKNYDRSNRSQALEKAFETTRLPIGIFYQESKPTYEEQLPIDLKNPVALQDIGNVSVKQLMESFC